MQDVLHTVSQPLPHDAFLPLSHSTNPNGGVQHHLLSGVGAGPPPPLPLGELISAVGPAGSNHPPIAYDHVTPAADDRLVDPPPPGLTDAGHNGPICPGPQVCPASVRHHRESSLAAFDSSREIRLDGKSTSIMFIFYGEG